MKFRVLIDGVTTNVFFTEEQAVAAVVKAHRDGSRWDVRARVGRSQQHRPINPIEARDFIAAVTKEV